jgi:hypothetical protein
MAYTLLRYMSSCCVGPSPDNAVIDGSDPACTSGGGGGGGAEDAGDSSAEDEWLDANGDDNMSTPLTPQRQVRRGGR